VGRDTKQLEPALETLETDQAERLATASPAVAAAVESAAEVQKPARRPLPENLPREDLRHPAPCTCTSCGGAADAPHATPLGRGPRGARAVGGPLRRSVTGDIDAFLAMGGYAAFVWPAYGVAIVVLGGLALYSWRRYRESAIALEQLQPRRGSRR
jgi:heme exporter protein CcmD